MFNDDIVLQINVALVFIFFLSRQLFAFFFQHSELCDKMGKYYYNLGSVRPAK